MNFLYPYRGSPKERLARLIGLENFFNLDPNECEFSQPILTDDEVDSNTVITVSAVDGSEFYTRSQTVHYNRVGINQIRRGMEGYIVDFPEVPTAMADLLRVVNRVYKTDLVVEEFEDEIRTVGHQVSITVSPNSLCWRPGSKLIIPAKYGELVDLATLITNTELDGFWPEGLPSLSEGLKVRNLNGFKASDLPSLADRFVVRDLNGFVANL